ncbi:MAG: Holliday junction resolvase RuvX [Bacteroidia bacterium]
MSRIMAIDYGSKRVGLAVTDENNIIASALTTVHSSEVIEFLKNYFYKHSFSTIVVGEPKRLNNEMAQSAELINNFVKHLSKTFPDKNIVRLDERFTSKMAFQTMIDSGLKKKDRQNKGLVDQISATIILQDYLSQLK